MVSMLIVSLVIAQAQPYSIRQLTLSSGGNTGSSNSYSSTTVAGQPAIGEGGSSTYSQQGGFWQPTIIAQQASTESVAVRNRWNMVSVPLTVNNYAKTALYPTATSAAFAYAGGYVSTSTLANGKGYWIKFGGNQSIPMTGFLRATDTVDVFTGWNLIGSISQSIPVSGITSLPLGIVTSQFFGYSAAYQRSVTIEPGKAYWVKVNQNGKLILSSSSNSPRTEMKIRIVQTGELPPPPPDASPDLAVENVPQTFALHQNFPNPFNPTTVIRYDVPVTSDVMVTITSVLGQEVGRLVDSRQDAGSYTLHWDASPYASGIYFFRMTAGGMSDGKSFTEVKKMLLMK